MLLTFLHGILVKEVCVKYTVSHSAQWTLGFSGVEDEGFIQHHSLVASQHALKLSWLEVTSPLYSSNAAALGPLLEEIA